MMVIDDDVTKCCLNWVYSLLSKPATNVTHESMKTVMSKVAACVSLRTSRLRRQNCKHFPAIGASATEAMSLGKLTSGERAQMYAKTLAVLRQSRVVALIRDVAAVTGLTTA